jgi:hypothetical protein
MQDDMVVVSLNALGVPLRFRIMEYIVNQTVEPYDGLGELVSMMFDLAAYL